MKEIKGNLITSAKLGDFDVTVHGCNCFCAMGAGIAPQMDKAFLCNNPKYYPLEGDEYVGDINKLGQIQYCWYNVDDKSIATERLAWEKNSVAIVNAYTQYHYGKNHLDGVDTPVDYDAITMCMRKINHTFKGKHIGLPLIGAGLAGGDWGRIKQIIISELKDMEITIIHYDKQ